VEAVMSGRIRIIVVVEREIRYLQKDTQFGASAFMLRLRRLGHLAERSLGKEAVAERPESFEW
jgi:hypothetical protein